MRFFHGGDECLTIPSTWNEAAGQKYVFISNIYIRLDKEMYSLGRIYLVLVWLIEFRGLDYVTDHDFRWASHWANVKDCKVKMILREILNAIVARLSFWLTNSYHKIMLEVFFFFN